MISKAEIPQQASSAPISVDEAKKLRRVLISLGELATDDQNIRNQLVQRAHLLFGKNIRLFDEYVNSCEAKGVCDRNELSNRLFELQQDLELVRVSSGFHFDKAKQINTTLEKFRDNLKADSYEEGKFDKVFNTINASVAPTQGSYASIFRQLEGIPLAYIPRGDSQQTGKENTRREREALERQVCRPLIFGHYKLWKGIEAKLSEALEDTANDTRRSSYVQRF